MRSEAVEFTVTFLGPFAVATGTASGGLDHRVDLATPLPSSSLKGLMRHEARVALGAPARWVDRIFGDSHGNPAAWRWTDAKLVDLAKTSLWSRVKLDEGGRSEERLLTVGEQIWADSAIFSVVPAGEAKVADQVLLPAAARHISSLGHQRRRGFGWVSVTDGLPWTEQDSRTLLEEMAKGGPQ